MASKVTVNGHSPKLYGLTRSVVNIADETPEEVVANQRNENRLTKKIRSGVPRDTSRDLTDTPHDLPDTAGTDRQP